MTEPQLNIPTEFKCEAINPWYPTGVFLRKDHVYTFNVPKKQVWHDGPHLRDIPPDGNPKWWYVWLYGMHISLRMPFERWFCLLGCIGKNKPYFRIGSLREEFSPPADGELICFANDSLWQKGKHYSKNNEGVITGTITRVK